MVFSKAFKKLNLVFKNKFYLNFYIEIFFSYRTSAWMQDYSKEDCIISEVT